MSEDSSADTFIPSGVDAQTWMGFEQRIRERRFQALLETVDQAVARGDRVAAVQALEEARELRPLAREVHAAAEQVAILESQAEPNNAAAGFVWGRVFGAVALLLVGVSLLIGLDWLRMPPQMPVAPPSASTLPALERLHLTLPVVVDNPPSQRQDVAPSRAKVRSRVAAAQPPARPSRWGKVFRPTARFFTNTLPGALGI